ncbi:hypothetical protein [Nodularia sp. UHCC 0506]|uniref:hypothetical protein n=1 Tax=Nodularia sp. UHCC 0506 TaxID=3110243 RepID=UPI002B20352B|nr:hypothetical protein [Nodularia sp. UHCC 0506]MEA5516165.1 hypothetical protein [Nodularia sp. UHCC 0506]
MVSTINVSNYELLVKPIVDSPTSPNRTVIQGYFLTISNPSLSNLQIQLTFKARTPNFNSSPLLAFWDVDDTNAPLIAGTILPCVRSYTFNLPALDTGLFLLQPDITQPGVISNQNTEIRGYVRLRIVSASQVGTNNARTLLLSAQQRGTFLPQGNLTPPAMGDFDQLAYSLPLATGGSEVTLHPTNITSVSALSLPNRERIFKAIEANPGFLGDIINEPMVEQIAELSVEEQKRMLYIFLERFQGSNLTNNQIQNIEPNGNLVNNQREFTEANGNFADDLQELSQAGA